MHRHVTDLLCLLSHSLTIAVRGTYYFSDVEKRRQDETATLQATFYCWSGWLLYFVSCCIFQREHISDILTHSRWQILPISPYIQRNKTCFLSWQNTYFTMFVLDCAHWVQSMNLSEKHSSKSPSTVWMFLSILQKIMTKRRGEK